MTPQSHTRNLDLTAVPPFRAVLDLLQPGASGAQAAALLDHRISREVANHWKAGRRHAPQWAIKLLLNKAYARARAAIVEIERLEKTPERPGLKAGARNLAAYLAARR